MKNTTILAVVLGILILVSMVQAVQLNGLKDTISDGGKVMKSAASSASTTSADSTTKTTETVPKSIQNLPQMVGGC